MSKLLLAISILASIPLQGAAAEFKLENAQLVHELEISALKMRCYPAFLNLEALFEKGVRVYRLPNTETFIIPEQASGEVTVSTTIVQDFSDEVVDDCRF